MKHLVVTECFDSIPISDAERPGCLTSIEADELANYARKQRLDENGVRISRYEVTFVNYVGFIQLESCAIEILPKVTGDDLGHSRRVLLRMLQRSSFLNVHESQVSQLMLEKMNLFDIIGHLYSQKLASELRKGVYKSYQTENGELQLVRGKINMNRQLRREGRKQSGVSCVYDDFQTDNPLNQTFKSALQTVLSRCRSSATKKRALSSLALLDEVSSQAVNSVHMERIQFDRTNRRFQDSFQLAKLLIGRSAAVSSPGRTRTSSILFKMNDLFEAYIAYMVRNIRDRVTIKDRSHKLLIREGSNRGVFQLEPDIVICGPNGQKIMDTKWKMIHSERSRHGVKRADFYQMYAYLTRYKQANEVILLYPYHDGIQASGQCLESWHLEGEPGKKLKVYAVRYEDEQAAEQELRSIIDEE